MVCVMVLKAACQPHLASANQPTALLLVMMPTWLSLPAYVWTEWLQDWTRSI